jgi:DNA-binding NarL/FixJ family response regulator
MDSAFRVFLVDDHQILREGLRARLDREDDIEVVGEAGTAAEAYDGIAETKPDLAILDIQMPGEPGTDLAKRIRARWPNIKVMMLSGYDFDQYVRQLVRIGVNGYLLKDSTQEELVAAVRQIARGGTVMRPEIMSKFMKAASAPGNTRDDALWELTTREIETLQLLYAGLRNSEIALRLSISKRTVEVHVRHILEKLGAQSRTEAVKIAREQGIVG